MLGFEKKFTEKDNGDGTITVSGNCVFTKKLYTVTVDKLGYDKWKSGVRIQNALPTASADDREFLLSGISPEGWEKSFEEE